MIFVTLFLSFVLLKIIVETILDSKNKRYIQKHQEAVPQTFAKKISLDDHKKAARYSLEKMKIKSRFDLLGLIVLLAWTLGGGLNLLDRTLQTLKYSESITGLLVFLCFILISTLIDLPQSIYSTFVLEEKFGFNKTTLKTFCFDLGKSILLGALIITPILYGVLSIIAYFDSYWWIIAWGFITLIQFVLIWAYPRFLAPLFNTFIPLEEGDLKNRITDLFNRTGFTISGFFIMDASRRSSHGNAYFTGFGKNKRIVFFDTLIKTLTPPEIEAVLAHELGHLKKYHIIKNLLKSIFLNFLGMGILGILLKSPLFYEAHGVEQISNYMSVLLFSLVAGQYTFMLTPLHSWFSRKYEFEADTFAHENSNGQDLITALIKMYKENASTLTPDPTYSAFYHSHPPALMRVEFLQSLLKNKNRKADTIASQ